MARTLFTAAAGKREARDLRAEARETFPDDEPGQNSYILGRVAEMLARNTDGHRPLPAEFWRGFGAELKV